MAITFLYKGYRHFHEVGFRCINDLNITSHQLVDRANKKKKELFPDTG
jgi:hypothetical protein